jgi:cysteine desulfurase
MTKRIYADNSATTAVSEKALNEMLPFFREAYGNETLAARLDFLLSNLGVKQ